MLEYRHIDEQLEGAAFLVVDLLKLPDHVRLLPKDIAGTIKLTYPDGTAVAYGYDVLTRLTMVTDPQNVTATYTYDLAGNLSIFTHFNGIITTYTYDAANRLLGMGSIVSNYQFTLDENGNRAHSTENEPLAATPSEAAISYGYNAQANRLLSAGAMSCTYDNEGQLASAGGAAYTLDYNHRLTGIGTDTTFSYDGRGNRLSGTRAGVTTRYVYDPWGNLLAEADGSNNMTRKYIYGKGTNKQEAFSQPFKPLRDQAAVTHTSNSINGLPAMATSSARYCHHFNGNGNTTALTDMNQNIVNSYTYDPFGRVLSQQETIPQPFKFVG